LEKFVSVRPYWQWATLDFLLVSPEDHVNRYSVQAAPFSFHPVIYEEKELCKINLSATFFRRNKSQLAISFQLIFISANLFRRNIREESDEEVIPAIQT
jgi:hypothetical protein